jgi:hypothetical protein
MTPPLTVACVWVRGEYPYGAEYVERLHGMCTRHLDRPFTFVCLTDRPELLREPVVAVRVAKLPGLAPWTKLELFNPARQWPGRVLYLDLDSLVVAGLAPIVDAPAPFALTDDPASAHRPRAIDAYGRAIVRRFNSSVMAWDGGTQAHLYERFTPAVADRLSGDQDWIGERAPSAHALPRWWFPRLSELLRQPGPPPQFGRARVVLAKQPKNAVAAATWPWFREAWR